MTDVADILNAAADLLEPEGAWTRGTMARDEDGRVVYYASPDACSWCATGAILKVANGFVAGSPAFDFLEQYLGNLGVGVWNDSHPNSKPVVAALRAAAEAAS